MRLIDADVIIEELEKVYEYYMAEIKDANEHPDNYTSKFIPSTAGRIDGIADAEIVIADAPTIEPDGDLISRKEVLETIIIAGECEPDLGYTHLHDVIEALPSATSQSLTKPNKSCEDDLISREDAVALVIKAIHGTDNKEIKEYLFDGLRKQMWSLPSAESTGAMDEAIQKYIKDGYMQPIGEDLISRQDAIKAVESKWYVYENKHLNDYEQGWNDACGYVKDDILEQLPSASNTNQHVQHVGCVDLISRQDAIDAFRDVLDSDFPYISEETPRERIESIPSAPDSRQRGWWIEYGDNYGHSSYFCSRCGTQEYEPSGFCPNCGARMYKGGDDE